LPPARFPLRFFPWKPYPTTFGDRSNRMPQFPNPTGSRGGPSPPLPHRKCTIPLVHAPGYTGSPRQMVPRWIRVGSRAKKGLDQCRWGPRERTETSRKKTPLLKMRPRKRKTLSSPFFPGKTTRHRPPDEEISELAPAFAGFTSPRGSVAAPPFDSEVKCSARPLRCPFLGLRKPSPRTTGPLSRAPFFFRLLA